MFTHTQNILCETITVPLLVQTRKGIGNHLTKALYLKLEIVFKEKEIIHFNRIILKPIYAVDSNLDSPIIVRPARIMTRTHYKTTIGL